jgi:hypothetical protein
MKKAALTAVLILLFAGAASAGETGIINQSGPYEATMKFYAHPAHGFPGTAETTPAAAPVSESVNAAREDGRGSLAARPREGARRRRPARRSLSGRCAGRSSAAGPRPRFSRRPLR